MRAGHRPAQPPARVTAPLSRCGTYFTSCTPTGAMLTARSAIASTGQRRTELPRPSSRPPARLLSRIAGRGKLGHGRADRNRVMVERAALLAPHLVGDLAGDLSVAQFEAVNQANVHPGANREWHAGHLAADDVNLTDQVVEHEVAGSES